MNGYERIIKIIEERIQTSNPISNIFLAGMTGGNSCTVAGQKLSGEDLLIAEHLTTGWYQEPDKKVEPLKSGDSVIVMQLSDTKYVILERVV